MRPCWLAALLALALTGCGTYNLETLRHTAPSGNAYQKAVAQGYLDMAQQQEKSYDWFNSMHFADKGLMAAYGKQVAPEKLKDWNLPAAALPDLEKARAALTAAVTPDHEEAQPQALADALVDFDCWVVRQEQGWQPDKIAHCRDGFEEAMATLGSAPEKPARAPMAQAQEKQSYIVFFAFDRSDLTKEGREIVDKLAQKLESEGGYEIVLNGHTDTTGSPEYDLKLSDRRAQAVKRRLVECGVKAEMVKTFAFGKSDPLVKTGDGVREPKNRRVEIFLNE